MRSYRKDDGLGHRYVEFVDDVVVKHFPDGESFRHESGFWHRAAAAEIAPAILNVREDDDGWSLQGTSIRWTRALEVPRMTLLTEYLRQHPEHAQEVGGLLVEKVLVLHGLGIAHRDLHAHNVVVDSDGQPYMVDWEFATDDGVTGEPYDFYGSTVSGVPPPWPHRNARPEGIFWDCENVLALGRHVGSLDQLLPIRSIVETSNEKGSTS